MVNARLKITPDALCSDSPEKLASFLPCAALCCRVGDRRWSQLVETVTDPFMDGYFDGFGYENADKVCVSSTLAVKHVGVRVSSVRWES